MNQISIFNLNCWLFPVPLSADCDARVSSILEMIRENNPDIITLQEVWSNKYLKILEHDLPDYFSISSKTPIYNQSGLVIFSKQKSIYSKVNFFKLSLRQNFTEWFLRKGYIKTLVEFNDKKFTIINTHLYAPFSKSAINIPAEQLNLVVGLTSEDNIILCGDFNLDEEQTRKIVGRDFFRMCDSEPTSDTQNPYSYKRFNKYMAHESKKIDYLLFKRSLAGKFKYNMIKNPFVSDHYPMLSHLYF